MCLTARERILMIRLIEKIKANPVATDKLGIIEIKTAEGTQQGG